MYDRELCSEVELYTTITNLMTAKLNTTWTGCLDFASFMQVLCPGTAFAHLEHDYFHYKHGVRGGPRLATTMDEWVREDQPNWGLSTEHLQEFVF